MLVRFSCGCIGLPGVDGDRAVVIEPCDVPTDMAFEPLGASRRDLSNKTYTPLEADKAAELWTELGKLIFGGYQLRVMRLIMASR